jgi:hypothetical protein
MNNFSKIELPKFEGILECLDQMILSNEIHWHNDQICLNSTKRNPNDPYDGVGSLARNWNNMANKNGCIVGVDETPRLDKECDFTELCDVFANNLIGDVYRMMESHYKLGRVRFIRSNPHTCMSWHKDDTKRLHLPLQTNEACRMVIGNECIHLTQNEWWMADTTHMHTAFNASRNTRIHLVASIIEK